jgi:hypothetical protein
MIKNKIFRAFTAFIFLFFMTSIALCGEMIKIDCSKCGYSSDTLLSGCGMMGIGHSIIFCPKCKTFYDITTHRVFESRNPSNTNFVNSIGKENFLERECSVYPCPKCGGDAYEYPYNNSKCPLCKKGTLKVESVGYWD